ncbi:MAG: glycyl-radical enzyme activating protein [Clostridiales bacterium]|nr:glycyl-radical enzyme activating protein [Clostridiales bacterium]
MAEGIIFSIEEFATKDGPGLRTSVFFKGCPLRCQWCHNPEGLSPRPQIIKNYNLCIGCKACEEVCQHPDNCIACGDCVRVCPRNLIRISGQRIDAASLAEKVKEHADILQKTGGGVTLTGGEVLMQGEFLLECLDMLLPLHRAIETSGYGDPSLFKKVMDNTDFIFLDIKMMDADKHKAYTGVSNEKILKNAEQLKYGDTDFVVRIPLICGVNNDIENLTKTAQFLQDAKNLLYVELLPYNLAAGSKYKLLDLKYEYSFQKPGDKELENARIIFESYGIKCKIA